MMSDGITSRSGARRRGVRRAYLWLLLAVVIALPTTALVVPGVFRLIVMQPARDTLFFLREIEPTKHYASIERHRPTPTVTLRLPAESVEADDVDIELDVWIPEHTPAPAVLLLHGASPRGRTLGFNMLLAQRLQKAGWLVVTPDTRGFGGSGSPRNLREPSAWSVYRDNSRLIEFARAHPLGDGTVTLVGHSQGGSYALQAEHEVGALAALVLIGPRRHVSSDAPDWWIRARFSSDRRIARMLPAEVVVEDLRRTELLSFAPSSPKAWAARPVLLLDGEREGPQSAAMLASAAAHMGPNVVNLTVPGSHHYCGAYQLPWPFRTVFLRPEVFDRCLEVLIDFLSSASTQT